VFRSENGGALREKAAEIPPRTFQKAPGVEDPPVPFVWERVCGFGEGRVRWGDRITLPEGRQAAGPALMETHSPATGSMPFTEGKVGEGRSLAGEPAWTDGRCGTMGRPEGHSTVVEDGNRAGCGTRGGRL